MPTVKRSVVITSIFAPGEAIRRFAALPDWQLVVVADRKTPPAWQQTGAHFLSVDAQRRLPFKIAAALPWNHYARKMIGYLWAWREGAQWVAESDDDNLPADDWSFPDFTGEFRQLPAHQGFVNVYALFSDQAIWPRGLPLARIRDPRSRPSRDGLLRGPCRVGVWQALADEDPDVDAIYRLTSNRPCVFEPHDPVVLGEGTLSPFNSQNTVFVRDLASLMYLPAHVNFRVTDILRSYVAQPIMWAAGYRLGIAGPTVRQVRNDHDFMDDFRSELPLYLQAEAMMAVIVDAVRRGDGIADNLHRVYAQLVRQEWVGAGEMALVDAWLEDLAGLS